MERKTKTSATVKNRYNDKAYDKITFVVPKGEKDKLKAIAESRGMNLSEYIKNAIGQYKQK